MRIASPLQAQQAGISTVYQEVNLCPNLSVAENIFIGREPPRFGPHPLEQMRRQAAELLDRLGLDIDVTAPLVLVLAGRAADGRDRAARAPATAMARAGAKVLILDEPTSSLDRDEVASCSRVMRRLQDEGVAILFVTHFLDQVYEVCRPDHGAAQRPPGRRAPHRASSTRSAWSSR